MTKNRKYLLAILQFVLFTVTSVNSWTAEFLTQTAALQCKPSDQQKDYTFIHGRKAGNFTTLGQVEDMDVCVLLCCELDTCEAAFLEEKSCFSVRCQSKDHCATAPAVALPKGQTSVAFVTRPSVILEPVKDHILNDVKSTSTQPKPSSVQDALKPESKQQSAETKTESLKDTKLGAVNEQLSDNEQETTQVKPVESQKNETLPELQAIQADKQTKEPKKNEIKRIQYSLISAAVATCLVAFILTGIALIAVKIRKQKEDNNSEEKMKLAEEGNR